MSLILNLDTAVQTASVCLANGRELLALLVNPNQKDHAAWLHLAINDVLKQAGREIREVNAIAISKGPGSYTGLRVGMSAAKGLCYALGLPLIGVSTLKMMALANEGSSADLLCPMIDARRMEVFTSVFDQELNEILPPSNLILNEGSYADLLAENTISFSGNGAAKFKNIVKSPNAFFNDTEANASHMVRLSQAYYGKKMFEDLAYSEPYYGKDFHSPSVK